MKQGPKIIDRGVVKGPAGKSAYQFDSRFRIVEPNGTPWAHQVRVDWSGDFTEISMLLGSEQYTVKDLSSEEATRIEDAVGNIGASLQLSDQEGRRTEPLIEEACFRETPAIMKTILRRHNLLSNAFCYWLKEQHGIEAAQDREQIDIRFRVKGRTLLAELKVCFGAGTTRSIREALGQVLEYNHYPKRVSSDTWMIVLDQEPSTTDRRFIELLREKRQLPIILGWRTSRGFSFHPAWP